MKFPQMFISAELKELGSDENANRTHILRELLHNRFLDEQVEECEGYYNGVKEVSFKVITYDFEETAFIFDTAFRPFRQEAVLGIRADSNGEAVLYFASGEIQELGRWTEVELVDALGSNSYTKIGDKYFRAI